MPVFYWNLKYFTETILLKKRCTNLIIATGIFAGLFIAHSYIASLV